LPNLEVTTDFKRIVGKRLEKDKLKPKLEDKPMVIKGVSRFVQKFSGINLFAGNAHSEPIQYVAHNTRSHSRTGSMASSKKKLEDIHAEIRQEQVEG
jgi:hypothetical protein